jgi:outer membrane protein assembly factor BamB
MSNATTTLNRANRWISLVWVATLLLPAFCFGQVNGDWTQFGFGPSNKRVNQFETVLSTTTVGGLHLRWEAVSTAGNSGPVLASGVLYGTGGGVCDGFNTNGTSRWVFRPTGHAVGTPAVEQDVANAVVYCGDDVGYVYALDASTGAVRWETYVAGSPVDTLTSSPTIGNNGLLYIATALGRLTALNASDGSVAWATNTGGNPTNSPAVSSGVVFISTGNSNVYAYNATTGRLKWTWNSGIHGCCALNDSPAVANDIVFVGGQDGNVYALNAQNGQRLWRFTTGAAINSAPAVANGVVYIGSDKLYALVGSNGERLWSYSTGSPVLSPVVANGVVYFGSDKLYALNATDGAYLWSYARTGTSYPIQPIVSHGVVYGTGGTDGTNPQLFAFGLN